MSKPGHKSQAGNGYRTFSTACLTSLSLNPTELASEFYMDNLIGADFIPLMSHHSMNRYRIPAKWITVDLTHGLSAYFELNASGSLKHIQRGIPIPRFIARTSGFCDCQGRPSSPEASDEWQWDDSNMFS
jgi:hypothetical protein